MRMCQNCQFAVRVTHLRDGDLECHLHPPKDHAYSKFPTVSQYDWCGRFKERPSDELPPEMLSEIAERAKFEKVLREYAKKVLDMMREDAKAQGGAA